MNNIFTDDELDEKTILIEKVADENMGAQHTAPIIALFEQRFEETFKRLGEGGRTPAL